MIRTQQIRPSQFITTYGPGAILEGVNGPRVIPLPDKGLFSPNSNYAPTHFPIHDQIMTAYLARSLDAGEIGIFRIPSNAELGISTDTTIYRTKPFPSWKLCLNRSHHQSQCYVLYKSDSCPICKNTERQNREPIRFIRACVGGHMDDVDWYRVLHDINSKCQHRDWFMWHGGGAMSSILLECPEATCSSSMNLGKAYSRKWPCSGRFPESETLGSFVTTTGRCQNNSRMIMRQASNLRISELRTLFSIPPRATSLSNILGQTYLANIIKFKMMEGQIWRNKDEFDGFVVKSAGAGHISATTAHELLYTYSWEEINQAITDVTSPIPSSYSDLINHELHELLKASRFGYPPIRNSSPVQQPLFEVNPSKVEPADNQLGKFLIMPILKLRTVTVQLGYRREVDTDRPAAFRDISFKDSSEVRWYPGVEFFGEGIFIASRENDGWMPKYNAGEFERWNSLDSTLYQDYLFRDPTVKDELSPSFAWWHTMSHLLIRTIAAEAGYSSASIRERIYLESEEGRTRGGILLYATQPGSEGTLGGLIALVPKINEIFNSAIQQLRTCSLDPLCYEHEMRSGGYNGAACYACTLLSETSCEHRNMWLDRRLLLGESK